MAPVLPTELLHDILGRIDIIWKWDWYTQGGPSLRAARVDLGWYMNLRLVNRLFDSIVIGRFIAAIKARNVKANSSTRCGPPTCSTVAMGKRLLQTLVKESSESGMPKGTYSLVDTIIEGSDKAVALLGPHQPDREGSPGTAGRLQEVYTDAIISMLGNLGADQIIEMCASGEDVEDSHKDNERGLEAVLMATAHLGRIEDMKLLLKLPGVAAKLGSGGKLLHRPMMSAAAEGRINMVKFLLKQGIDPNFQTVRDGAGVVHFAAFSGHTKLVRFLVEGKGVEADVKDKNGHTPLVWAISMGHEDVVQELLGRRGSDINSADQHAETDALFLQALKRGKVSILDAVVSSIPEIRHREDILHRAVEEGTENIVQYILSLDKFDVNSLDNKTGDAPLHLAISSGDLGKVQALLEQPGADVNIANSYTKGAPLHTVCQYLSNPEIMNALLAHPDINVNYRDTNGRTPLAHAAQYGESEAAKLLLARDDLDIFSVDNNGNTALLDGVGWDEIMDLLLERMGNNIWHKNHDGTSVLARATYGNNEKFVKRLLDTGPGLTRDIVSDAIQSTEEKLRGPKWLPKKIATLIEIREYQKEVREGTYQILLKHLEQMEV